MKSKRKLISGTAYFIVFLTCFLLSLAGRCHAKPKPCKCKYEQIAIVNYIETRARVFYNVNGTLTITKTNDLYIRIPALQYQLSFKFDTCIQFKNRRIFRVNSKSFTGFVIVTDQFAYLDVWEKEKKGIYTARLYFKEKK